jgi:1-acyl-sn-glycerol-3-phosphate acyltransferase
VTQVDSRMAGNSRASLILYAVVRAYVVGFSRLWNRMTVQGLEHVPARGPFVLAPIHRSNMDSPYAACATKRRLRYMGKDSLWRHRWAGWFLSACGGFPVTRGTSDREALQRALEVLEAGEPLVVFPEGERKYGPIVQPLFEGAAYLAAKTQVPIVPVGIGGSERVQRRGSKMVWPRKVHVIFGAPLAPPALRNGRIDRDATKAVTAALHETLQDLFDRAQVRAGV